jgi:N-acetylglucosamine-6-phosphate deacetylase
MPFALYGAKLFDGDAFHVRKAVLVDGARITDVIDASDIPRDAEKIMLNGGILAPGFIDVQVNGGGGALLNDDPSPETVRRIAESHRKFGTVAMLPTVITDAPDVLKAAISAVRECRTSGVLGIHIEGPFLDPVRKGAHDQRYIRKIGTQDIQQIISANCGSVMLTLAPNCVASADIAILAEAGILVSLGHADATLAEANQALKAGARAFTHLYNAMSQLGPREPGMVGAALADKDSFCGLIADGHHVHATALNIAVSARTPDRIMLVTDAMSSAAGGLGEFNLQGRRVRRTNGRLQLDDGTLAGSDLTMDRALRYCVEKLGIELGAALRMASTTPAAFLRCEHELGRIRKGHLASLVHLNDELHVTRTWVEGV